MTALVQVAPQDVDSLDAALASLARIEQAIGLADDAEYLKDIADQARLVMEMERIRKLGVELHRAALRVSVLAWRRIGQLGASIGSAAERQAARYLAKATPEQIDELLVAFTGRSVQTFAYALAARLRDSREADIVRSGGPGPRPDPNDPSRHATQSLSNLQDAARLILEQIADAGEGFTVPDAAEGVLRELGIESTSLTSLAAQEVVRSAIASCADDADHDFSDYPAECPTFVTYRSGDSWVRMPWRKATVEQLIWMAEYRKAQAVQMEAAASQLGRTARWFEARGNDQDLLGDVVRKSSPARDGYPAGWGEL
jgi:hypothetical protein